MSQQVDMTLTVEDGDDTRPLAVRDLGSDVIDTLGDGRAVCETPGTPEQLAADEACRWVVITALPSNTGRVNVGGAAVSAALGTDTGQPLDARDSVTFPVSNVNKVYVDARIPGEGVSYTRGF